MHNDTALVATIAVSLAFAFLCGFAAVRLRLPPLVGYLIAGVIGQSLIVAGALFSITLNPLVFRTLGVAGSKAPARGMEIPRTLK